MSCTIFSTISYKNGKEKKIFIQIITLWYVSSMVPELYHIFLKIILGGNCSGGIIQGAIILGGNCPGGGGGIFQGAIILGGNCPGGGGGGGGWFIQGAISGGQLSGGQLSRGELSCHHWKSTGYTKVILFKGLYSTDLIIIYRLQLLFDIQSNIWVRPPPNIGHLPITATNLQSQTLSHICSKPLNSGHIPITATWPWR